MLECPLYQHLDEEGAFDFCKKLVTNYRVLHYEAYSFLRFETNSDRMSTRWRHSYYNHKSNSNFSMIDRLLEGPVVPSLNPDSRRLYQIFLIFCERYEKLKDEIHTDWKPYRKSQRDLQT